MPADKLIPFDTPASPVQAQSQQQPGNKVIPFDQLTQPVSLHGGIPGAPEMPTRGFVKESLENASGLLPMAGGFAGSIAGPEGTAVGAGTGAVLRDIIQRYTHGEQAPDFLENAATFGKNALMTGVGGKVSGLAVEAFPGPVESKLASSIANAIVGQGFKAAEGAPTNSAELSKDALMNLGFEIVGNQLIKRTGPKPPQEGPITLGQGMGQLREQTQIGQGPTTKEGIPAKNSAESGMAGMKAIRSKFGGIDTLEKSLYNKFENVHVKDNTIQVPRQIGTEDTGIVGPDGKNITRPKIEVSTIKGPIYTNESTKLAADLAPKIEAFMQGAEYQSLPDYQKARYARLNDVIKKLTDGTPTLTPDGKPFNLPVLDFNTAKEMKTIISQTVGGKTNKTFGEGALTKFAQAIDKDIDGSVTNWKNGASAKATLDEAHATTTFKKKVFDKEIMDRLSRSNEFGKLDTRLEGDPSKFFDKAVSSPEAAQRMKTALGPENEGILKQHYLDNVLTPKGFGANYEKFNPRAIISELEDPNSVSRTILGADERNSMLRLMRAADASSGMKDRALSFHESMVSIAAGRAIGGPVGGLVRVGVNELLHAISSKPEIGEYASRLVKLPPGSDEAAFRTKQLMRALRGTEVNIDVGGEDRKARVTDAGKLQIIP